MPAHVRERESTESALRPASLRGEHGDVEKLREKFKCHRGSIDFDFKFIRDA